MTQKNLPKVYQNLQIDLYNSLVRVAGLQKLIELNKKPIPKLDLNDDVSIDSVVETMSELVIRKTVIESFIKKINADVEHLFKAYFLLVEIGSNHNTIRFYSTYKRGGCINSCPQKRILLIVDGQQEEYPKPKDSVEARELATTTTHAFYNQVRDNSIFMKAGDGIINGKKANDFVGILGTKFFFE